MNTTTTKDCPSASLQDYKDELNRRIESDAYAFSKLAEALDTVTAQRDELLAVIHKIERRTRGADGSNQHPSGALRSIGAIARTAISKAEQH